MKILKRVLVSIAVLLVMVLVVVIVFLGQVVKTTVETVGPQVAGVEMSLEKARVYLLLGDVKLKGLVIGNPEGFKTPSAIELAQFVVDLDMGSLFTDTIVIKKIHIDGPQITYERGLKTSNLSQIQKNIAPDEKKPKKEKAEAPKEKSDKPAKKVVIEDFLLENGKVNVSISLAGGNQLTVPLAPMHLTNIGKDSGGASVAEIINEVYGAVMTSVGNAVASSGDMAGDAIKGASDLATGVAGDTLKGAGNMADDATEGATEAVKGATEGLKKFGSGLFGGKE